MNCLMLNFLFDRKRYWTHFKSSIDPEVANVGQHGGVGFVCKESNDFSFRFIEVNSDRIDAIQ